MKPNVVSISCWDFDILLVSSLTIFGSAGEKALLRHSKMFTILHRGAKRAILTRVNIRNKRLKFSQLGTYKRDMTTRPIFNFLYNMVRQRSLTQLSSLYNFGFELAKIFTIENRLTAITDSLYHRCWKSLLSVLLLQRVSNSLHQQYRELPNPRIANAESHQLYCWCGESATLCINNKGVDI